MSVSNDTEILTQTGFKTAFDISHSDMIVVITSSLNRLRFQKPETIKRAEKEVVTLTGDWHDEVCGVDGYIVIDNNKLRLSDIHNTSFPASKFVHCINASANGLDGISPSRLRLIPWLVLKADIHFGMVPKWGKIQWRPMSEDHEKRLRELLFDAGYDVDLTKEITGKQFETLAKVFDGKPSIPEELVNASKTQMAFLHQELQFLYGGNIYSGLSPRDMDVLQIMYFRNNMLSRITQEGLKVASPPEEGIITFTRPNEFQTVVNMKFGGQPAKVITRRNGCIQLNRNP